MSDCKHENIEEVEGMPGETLSKCMDCGKIIDVDFEEWKVK